MANHGKAEPGLGVKTDGQPLPLNEMAEECLFDATEDLIAFLDLSAEREAIHRDVWTQKRIVFLPAMFERVTQYYRTKTRRRPAFASAAAMAEAILMNTAAAIRATAGHGVATAGHRVATNKQTDKTQTNKKTLAKGSNLLDDAGEDQVAKVMQTWNTLRTKGPKASQLTDRRRDQIQQALAGHPNIEDWRITIAWIDQQAWCNASGVGEFPNYRMTLDDLLKPGKLTNLFDRAKLQPADRNGRDARRGVVGVERGKYQDIEE